MTYKHETRLPATTWILVADRSRARVLAAQWPELTDLAEIKTLTHPEGSAHQRDVEADGPGRFQEPGGPHHSGDAQTDFSHRTATDFAREVVAELQRGKDADEFGRLVIVAPPLFLGVLREQLPEPVRRLVVADSDKHLTHADASQILAEVREKLGTTTG
jgi:protein required for attachment to host cells